MNTLYITYIGLSNNEHLFAHSITDLSTLQPQWTNYYTTSCQNRQQVIHQLTKQLNEKKLIRKIINNYIIFTVNNQTNIELIKTLIENINLKIQLQLLNQHSTNESKFMLKYNKLKNYINKYNTYPISSDKGESKILYNWIITNIANKRKGKLNKERITLLEKLPAWTWDINNNTFGEMYNLYLKDPSNPELIQWITKMKHNYRNNKLSTNKKKKLELLPNWSSNKQYKGFNRRYDELLSFISKNNRFPINSRKMDYDEFLLGRWVLQIKNRYKKGKLNVDHIKKVENIKGWKWQKN